MKLKNFYNWHIFDEFYNYEKEIFLEMFLIIILNTIYEEI